MKRKSSFLFFHNKGAKATTSTSTTTTTTYYLLLPLLSSTDKALSQSRRVLRAAKDNQFKSINQSSVVVVVPRKENKALQNPKPEYGPSSFPVIRRV